MAETVPGGYYIGEDGRPHDAMGRPLSVSKETAVAVLDGLRQDGAPDAEPPKKGRRK